MDIASSNLSYMKRELLDESHSGPKRAREIIHGEEGILKLLRYVEENLARLHAAETASNGSEAALAQLQEAAFNIQAPIRRATSLRGEPHRYPPPGGDCLKRF